MTELKRERRGESDCAHGLSLVVVAIIINWLRRSDTKVVRRRRYPRREEWKWSANEKDRIDCVLRKMVRDWRNNESVKAKRSRSEQICKLWMPRGWVPWMNMEWDLLGTLSGIVCEWGVVWSSSAKQLLMSNEENAFRVLTVKLTMKMKLILP